MNESNNPLPDEVDFVTVATVDEIPEGAGKAFEVGDKMVAVFKIDGQIHAIDDQCPHMGASLASGFIEGCEVACPWHAWRFDVRDGTWCDNRRIKIDSFQTRIVDNQVQIAKSPKSPDN